MLLEGQFFAMVNCLDALTCKPLAIEFVKQSVELLLLMRDVGE
jgi:hypothetical protein